MLLFAASPGAAATDTHDRFGVGLKNGWDAGLPDLLVNTKERRACVRPLRSF